MDLEEAFQVVGEFGPYQKRAVAILVLTQQKKGGKKESKIPARSKASENEAALTPQKSRLPLRCQN